MPDIDDSPAPVPAVSSAVHDFRLAEEQRPKNLPSGNEHQRTVRSQFYGPRVEALAALRLQREPLGISLFEEASE